MGPRRPAPLAADERWIRLVRAIAILVTVLAVGTIGYLIIGLTFLEALYQSVTTVTTVGFTEVVEPTASFRIFTIVLVLLGAGSVLYALGVLLESLVEGRITERFERRRMERRLAALSDHVIICGWGRVGKAIGVSLAEDGTLPFVVVDREPERLTELDLVVAGDATDDAVLRAAGIERARALVAALSADADNVYVTLAARRAHAELFIVARARVDTAEALLHQAGADRVVNPQAIGGARMAAMLCQPHVAEFVDVVMHEASLEFRLAEITVPAESAVAGLSIRDAQLRDATGALVLAMRNADSGFRTNPDPGERIEAGEVLIAIGTEVQLQDLRDLVTGGR